ncbi:carbohydrate ABC transporter permease [Mesoplasma seiffertii]|uniref:carbohydrate ABC transporter permease n=1 Tax=Mesoplasma seiffertii TaxID=28224 RepID=UPI000684D688|nr:sugar ABC transporter permease [Mesoplasma seiffertii]
MNSTVQGNQNSSQTPEKNGFKLKYWDNRTKTVKTVKNKKTVKKDDSFFLQLIWIAPAFFFLIIFTFYAAFIVFKNGFNGSGRFLIEWVFSTLNFRDLFEDPTFIVAMRNSLVYVVVVVPIGLIISIGVAKALSSVLNKRIFSFLQGVFFLPYVTSAMAIAMAFAFMFSPSEYGLFNRMLSAFGINAIHWTQDPRAGIWMLLIFGIWRSLPFSIVMLTAAFMRVNPQYYSAASIDGMKKWKQFWRISMPGIMPTIIYLSTIGIIGAFKAMPLGLFSSESGAELVKAQTVVLWIYEKTTGASQGTVSHQQAGAASIVLMGIILVITIVSRQTTKVLSKRYK